MEQNPFQEIETNKEVPIGLRKNVMSEIASIGLFGDFADLFTVKFASTIGDLLTSKKNTPRTTDKEK